MSSGDEGAVHIVRVAIVDDDHWIRTGRSTALSAFPDIEVVSAVGPDQALRQSIALWDNVDVALVDAYDSEAGFDRFPGAAVVRAIRAHPRGAQIAAVVITGHVANDTLRIRMAEAGADLFYGHSEIGNPAQLHGVIRRASAMAAFVHSSVAPPSMLPGRPDAAVDWIARHGHQRAFDGGTQKTLPVSRRTIMTIRRNVGAFMGDRTNPSGPPWRRVNEFVNKARGADIERP